MKIFSANQIRSWDAFTVLNEPVSSVDLMERAAASCFHWLMKNSFDQGSFKIFCGNGNNGGDGLTLARLLSAKNNNVAVYILDTSANGSADFEINLKRLQEHNVAVYTIVTIEDFPNVQEDDIIIDALFGTDLNKAPIDIAAAAINFINQSPANVISIDIPSGMYADKSSLSNAVVVANHTLSFQQYKLAFMMPENEKNFGDIHLLDIGLHPSFKENEPANFELIDDAIIKNIYQPRKQFAHKGTYGHALIYAGSKGMVGAAVLSAKACLRSGVGLLTVAVPDIGYTILQSTVPEVMCLTDTDDKFMEACWDKKAAIGIGPGWGTDRAAFLVIENIIAKWKGKLVLDATALSYLAQYPAQQKLLPANAILTPHPKEFDTCFGKSENDFARMELALHKAAELNIYIILKGHHTLIATPEGKGYFNNTGNAGMATGGSGDVLTGIITGLVTQGYSCLHACLLGVYLHGLAGDLATAELSQEAMLAGDIVGYLGHAFKLI